MARTANPSREWPRWVPPGQVLDLADQFEELTKGQDPLPTLSARLVDDTVIQARSLEELRADMADVRERDVLSMSLGIGVSEAAIIWLDSYAPKISATDGQTR